MPIPSVSIDSDIVLEIVHAKKDTCLCDVSSPTHLLTEL